MERWKRKAEFLRKQEQSRLLDSGRLSASTETPSVRKRATASDDKLFGGAVSGIILLNLFIVENARQINTGNDVITPG